MDGILEWREIGHSRYGHTSFCQKNVLSTKSALENVTDNYSVFSGTFLSSLSTHQIRFRVLQKAQKRVRRMHDRYTKQDGDRLSGFSQTLPLSFGGTNTRDHRTPVLRPVEGDINPVPCGVGCRV